MTTFQITTLICGCKIKAYSGGMTFTDSCGLPGHDRKPQFVCPNKSCGKICKSRLDLKKHRWVHAL